MLLIDAMMVLTEVGGVKALSVFSVVAIGESRRTQT